MAATRRNEKHIIFWQKNSLLYEREVLIYRSDVNVSIPAYRAADPGSRACQGNDHFLEIFLGYFIKGWPCRKESTEVWITQNNGKERKNPYHKLKRSPEERHTQTHGNLFEILQWSQTSFSIRSDLVEKDVCGHQNISDKFLCVCVCLSSRDLFNFW